MKLNLRTILWLIVICLGLVVLFRDQSDNEERTSDEVTPRPTTIEKETTQENLVPPKDVPVETINNIPVPPETKDALALTQANQKVEDFKTKWKQIQSLPLPEQYQARNLLMSEWIALSPANALEAFNQSPDQSKAGMIATIASSWAKHDPHLAAKWALQLPPKHSPRALAHVVRGWSKKDQTSAFRYAETIPSGAHKSAVYTLLAQDSSESPVGIARWLTTQDDQPEVNKALLALTTRWSRTSSKSAEAWTQQLPPGNARDFSLQGLSRGVLSRDPEKSFYYAQQIRSPSIQRLQMRSLVNDYAQTCLPCHRKQAPLNCLRQQVQSLPPSMIPQDMKSRVFKIVQENLDK